MGLGDREGWPLGIYLVSEVNFLLHEYGCWCCDAVCEDFLERWGMKPVELAFTQCERIENPQFDRSEYLKLYR
jgi:hypothetical protein